MAQPQTYRQQGAAPPPAVRHTGMAVPQQVYGAQKGGAAQERRGWGYGAAAVRQYVSPYSQRHLQGGGRDQR